MRLKSFYAKTMTEAMQMVRDTLGEDAVIVATREERGGRAVRVTAAIEPSFEFTDDIASDDGWLQYDDEMDEAAVAEEITDALLNHAVPEAVMDQILSCASVLGETNPAAAMTAALEHIFMYKPLPQRRSSRAFMMVGAPGSGKTLAAAKLATRGVMNDMNIGVVSTDTSRAGGIEQLEAFTKLLNIDLKRAGSDMDLPHILDDMRNYDQVIIDSSGVNPFDQDHIKQLAKLIDTANIEPVLVMPAGCDAEECGEMARAFATIGVQSMVSTRIDIARRLGSIVNAAYEGKLAFADVSNTPKVADGLIEITPESLARLLMPASFRHTGRTADSARAPDRHDHSPSPRPKKRAVTGA